MLITRQLGVVSYAFSLENLNSLKRQPFKIAEFLRDG